MNKRIVVLAVLAGLFVVGLVIAGVEITEDTTPVPTFTGDQ